MNRLGLITCGLVLCTVGIAHANQVETPPPPPPAPAATSPAPSEAPPAPPPAPAVPPPPPAAPQPAPQVQWQSGAPADSDEGTEVHDGFFLRMALGFGGASWSADVGSSEMVSGATLGANVKWSGLSAGIDIAIGAVLTDNLALHASLFGMGVSDPSVTVDGEDLGTAEKVSLTGSGLGVGLTYYLMPANVYFSGAIGLGNARFTTNRGTSDEKSGDTDNGFALNLMVGKEWWVSDEWGLGVAAQLVHVDAPLGGTRLVGTGLQLMFSATYN